MEVRLPGPPALLRAFFRLILLYDPTVRQGKNCRLYRCTICHYLLNVGTIIRSRMRGFRRMLWPRCRHQLTSL
eukprot:568830-Amorphochlora_amoeboformis.AAC.1